APLGGEVDLVEHTERDDVVEAGGGPPPPRCAAGADGLRRERPRRAQPPTEGEEDADAAGGGRVRDGGHPLDFTGGAGHPAGRGGDLEGVGTEGLGHIEPSLDAGRRRRPDFADSDDYLTPRLGAGGDPVEEEEEEGEGQVD